MTGRMVMFILGRNFVPSSSSFYCNKGMTERKPTNDKLLIQTNNNKN